MTKHADFHRPISSFSAVIEASVLLFVAIAGCGTTSARPSMSLVAEASTDEPADAAPKAKQHVVRKTIVRDHAEGIPPVLLTTAHQKLCKKQVGDKFPRVTLPRLGGRMTELSNLLGKQATVVLFWHPDRWMARTALTDLQRDVFESYDPRQVAVVGIGVELSASEAGRSIDKSGAKYPQLIDRTRSLMSQVGYAALPRLYVLDPSGKIVWFDIEYSEGTRRELQQTLEVLTNKTAEATEPVQAAKSEKPTSKKGLKATTPETPKR